jgi:uncharacterized protein YcaQ
LPTSAIEDRAAVSWQSGGWNDGKNVAMMLEALWAQGVVTIAARNGRERLWDLADRVLPVAEARTPHEIALELIDRQLRAFGVARSGEFGLAFDGPTPGFAEALRELTARGRVRPVAIDGLKGDWYVHPQALEAPFTARRTVLSPFDRLIHDRRRASQLFGFEYKLEIYVPAAKREYGYYVLPVLHGDRLIGRIDPVFDRAEQTLHVKGTWIEPGAPDGSDEAISHAIHNLAGWLGATQVIRAPSSSR